jgi:hypothetical protein
MDPAAIAKVENRLERANVALEAIRNARTFKEFEPAWTDFLLAFNSIFGILEKGAKTWPKSEHWFGQIKGERRTDPMLSYLRHARNADEHGVHSVVERRLSGGITFGDQPAGPRRKITRVTFKPAGGKEIELAHDEKGLSNMTVLRPVTVLIKVFDDRSKNGSTHLKNILASRSKIPNQSELLRPV